MFPEIILSKMKHQWRRILIICGLLFFVMVRAGQFNVPPGLLVNRVFIFLMYSSFFILPSSWWKPKWMVLATLVLSTLVILSLVQQNDRVSIFMLIVLALPSSRVFERSIYPYYFGGIILLMFLLLTIFGHQSYLQAFSFIFLLVGVVLSLRARVNRREAYRLSQLHLQELEKAHQELQEAAVSTMQYAVLDERTRIAREIHDAVGHSLTSIIVQLQALRYMVEVDPTQAKRSVEEMLTVARQGLNDIRISVHALAEDQTALGITPLQALISRMNATTMLFCTFSADGQSEDLPVAIGSVFFKVLQEAMTNILRHSQATQVEVELSASRTEYRMSIKDNGQFAKGDPLNEGFGLKSMRERVREAGGTIEFLAGKPSGLTLLTTLPYHADSQEIKGE